MDESPWVERHHFLGKRLKKLKGEKNGEHPRKSETLLDFPWEKMKKKLSRKLSRIKKSPHIAVTESSIRLAKRKDDADFAPADTFSKANEKSLKKMDIQMWRRKMKGCASIQGGSKHANVR